MAKKTKRPTRARSKARAKARPRARAKGKPAAVRAKGLQSVAAGFTVNDAAASIKWYCDVLGFKVQERWEHEGAFLGGSVAQGAVTINIGQDDWGYRAFSLADPDGYKITFMRPLK